MLLQSKTKDIKEELAAYFCAHPGQAVLKEKINSSCLFSGEVLPTESYLRQFAAMIGHVKAFFEHYLRFFVCRGVDFFNLEQSNNIEAYSNWNNALYSIACNNKRMDQIVSSFNKTEDRRDFVTYFYTCLKNEMRTAEQKEASSDNSLSGYKDSTLAAFHLIKKYLAQEGREISDTELYRNTELMRLLNIKKISTYERLLQDYAMAQKKMQSLDQPLHDKDGESELSLGDKIEDRSAESALYFPWDKTSLVYIKQYLEAMEPVWRHIFIALYTNNEFLTTVSKRYKNLTYLQAYKKDPKGIFYILRELYDCGVFSKEVIAYYLRHPLQKLNLEKLGLACNRSKQLLSIHYKKETEKLAAYLKEKTERE